jgi:hypothetical protein
MEDWKFCACSNDLRGVEYRTHKGIPSFSFDSRHCSVQGSSTYRRKMGVVAKG